ncbi:acyltransferase family protein [Cerasicoccus fimbriatus]|uniref:acyltransferase family protein n=1 Tax=Cerasicoccus fimbriatus TaxID=3014554 RepID=UPI0022B3FFBA|nr:acyltransferase [Cerasicoccus sp. TK19100]
MTKGKDNYMPQLDALRTFAVAAVAFSHWVPNEYHFGLPIGPGGVQLFFVLSGFLITGILLRCQEYQDRVYALKSFYARRFLRIFPLFYGILFVGALLNISPIRETFLWHFAYLSNFYFFVIQEWNGPVSHFWSLAVEEQFYLIWPTIILFAPRKMISTLVMVTIGVGIFSRYGLANAFPEVRFISLLPTSALVSLGLGAGLACYKANLIGKRFIGLISSGIPVYLALLVLQEFGIRFPFHGSLMDFFLMLGFTWLVYKASAGFQGLVGRLLSFSVLIYLGKISYGLYVLHNFAGIPVLVFTEKLGLPFLKYGFSGIILKTIFTVAGASLSWHFFEQPINRFKSRFPYRSPKEISDSESNSEGH